MSNQDIRQSNIEVLRIVAMFSNHSIFRLDTHVP